MELQDSMRQFGVRKATIVAVSADSMEDARQMAERLELTFPVLVDPKLEVIDAYGLRQEDREISVPAAFVLDARGKIIYQRIGKTASDRPEVELLLDALDGKL